MLVRKEKGICEQRPWQRCFLIKSFSLFLLLSPTILLLAFMDPDIDVNLFVVIPWFCLISLVTASFLICFNFGGRRYHDMFYSGICHCAAGHP